MVSPPVHAGILPSALPAFSAPNGVNFVPSCAACSAVTAANADTLNSAGRVMMARKARLLYLLSVFIESLSSERTAK
ncbi:hypothetical protein D3C86_1921790 [compost metagenome]